VKINKLNILGLIDQINGLILFSVVDSLFFSLLMLQHVTRRKRFSRNMRYNPMIQIKQRLAIFASGWSCLCQKWNYINSADRFVSRTVTVQ
jgi:hypothetical protein